MLSTESVAHWAQEAGATHVLCMDWPSPSCVLRLCAAFPHAHCVAVHHSDRMVEDTYALLGEQGTPLPVLHASEDVVPVMSGSVDVTWAYVLPDTVARTVAESLRIGHGASRHVFLGTHLLCELVGQSLRRVGCIDVSPVHAIRDGLAGERWVVRARSPGW